MSDSKPIRPPGLNPDVMTLAEAEQCLGCGRTRLAALIKDGEVVRARSFGRYKLVTTASVDRARATMTAGDVVAAGSRRRVTAAEADTAEAFRLARAGR